METTLARAVPPTAVGPGQEIRLPRLLHKSERVCRLTVYEYLKM